MGRNAERSDGVSAPKVAAQSAHVAYELHTLGWKAFQDLAIAVADEILKRPVETFLPSGDGGRDGAFIGRWDGDPTVSVPGRSTIQCKFTSKRTSSLRVSDVKSELEKAERLASRGLAEDYVLLTNYGVSGPNAAKIVSAFEDVGVSQCRVYGGDWITEQIRRSARLRVMVPRVYGLGDLSQILDERAYAQSRSILSALGDDLSRFVITDAHRRSVKAILDHQFVLLLGDPASGKSTIAASLAVGALDHWRSPTIRVSTPEELTRHWNPHEPAQFFWVDDAFGQTQYQRQTVDAWNRQLPLMSAALRKGARFLLTSRTYIWRAAHRDLKTSAFPLFDKSQVVIDVQGLQPAEKAQILYNHIKLGDQQPAYRKRIKPFLADVAADPGFLPETARRLGSRFFTTGLRIGRESVLDFTQRPVEFLKDVLRNLDRAAAGAVALVFMHGGAVPSPIESDERTELIVELLGVSAADLRHALETLRGSLMLLLEKPEGQFWTFKHPTIADAYAALVAESSELTEIYLRGAQYEKLLSEVVCGVEIEGAAVRVPRRLYPVLLNRITAKPVIDYRVRYFLAERCDREFLSAVVTRIPAILELRVTPFMAYSSETSVLAKLHELDLLPEEHRRTFVEHVEALTIAVPDSAALRDDRLRSLFTTEEFEALKERIRQEVVSKLDDIISEWQSNCPADEDPESYFDEFDSMLTGIEWQFDDDSEVINQIRVGRGHVKLAIESLNESRPPPSNRRIETPTGQTSTGSEGLDAIFDDVDQ